MSPNNDLHHLLGDTKTCLEALYGSCLCGVYLYGSFARGDQDEESDVDLLVVLDDFTSYGQEVDRTAEIVSDLSLKWCASISVVFVSRHDWVAGDSLFLRTLREEAVAA